MKKIIFYELNEVPLKVIEAFSECNPDASFAKLLSVSTIYKTMTPDAGGLSPWITWPTLHRGVDNSQHGIKSLGHDLFYANLTFPNYFDIVARRNYRVGVFGSLHTFPVPSDISNYPFYVPDTFAEGSNAYPPIYGDFQSLNLYMTRRNGRNISKTIPVRQATKFVRNSISLGVTPLTYAKVLSQISSEIFMKHRVVRRRTTQAQIAFDLFYKALVKNRPDLTTFFTNHVASSMHRYWPATFPGDYKKFSMPEQWRRRYRNEIWHSMKEADHHLGKLLDFVKSAGDYTLVVASSMGQAALDSATHIESEILLERPQLLMNAFGIAAGGWQQKSVMSPQYVFKLENDESLNKFTMGISALRVKGEEIRTFMVGERSVQVHFGQPDFDPNKHSITLYGEQIHIHDLGLKIVRIQDETDSYAYHVPEGVLLIFNGSDYPSMRPTILTTQIAPSILRHFAIEPPAYMHKGTIDI